MEPDNKNTVRTLGGRYEIGEFIGHGGMATVYRGIDTKLGRQVAIKIMKADLADDASFRGRFRQEAQAAARMAHPTIVRVLDAGDDLIQTPEGAKQLPFIVMEYVEGKNLRQHLAEGRVSVEEACRITDAVLTALEYSHRAGIVHRDIKPANIMVTSAGRVKVMDFGIARAVSETSSTLQQTTQILGTAAYFSPEQARGETVDSRTDLYATGVLLYEMLTGRVPFKGDSAVSVAYQHVSERPVPPQEREPQLSDALNTVTLHSLIKDKTRRFQTAGEFRASLAEAVAGRTPALDLQALNAPLHTTEATVSESELAMRQLSAKGASRSQSRPPVLWTWAAIVTVVAVVTAIGFWLFNLAPKEILPSSSRPVPELVNQTQNVAEQQLKELGLKVLVVEETSETVAAGQVTRTDPQAGVRMTSGGTVTLYISVGAESVSVPDIKDMTLQEAEAALTKLGLKIGTISHSDDPHLAKDQVISVSPEPGTKINKSGSVKVTVSSGEVTVPDLKGQSLQAARTMLDGLGLIMVPQPRTCEITGSGLPVIEQSAVGKTPQRAEVTVAYCAGVAASDN